ncbi:MAG: nitroreductase family protein [Paramuribaculum sp.]|nr:nitroreductase family protein [Paramuribaculum sp.]
MNNVDLYPKLYDVVAGRYSCRAYTPAPVSREMVLAVLDAARLAPSACNRQPWKFIIADNQETRELVIGAYGRDWVKDVQTFIIACGDHSQAWHRADGKDHTDIDVAIAVEHICLAASSLGLGTCWICNFDAKAISDGLSLPENLEPIAIIPIGYPNPTAPVPAKSRKAIDEIVKWGKF